jgi:hypothetical protein
VYIHAEVLVHMTLIAGAIRPRKDRDSVAEWQVSGTHHGDNPEKTSLFNPKEQCQMSVISISAARMLLPALVLVLAVPLQAQDLSALSIDQQIEIMRTETEAERQIIVMANLSLTEEESEAFWPVYRNYREEAVELNDRIKDLVMRYAYEYDDLSGEMAYSLVEEIFPLQIDMAKLKQKHLKRFAEVVSPMNAARAMQIENKIDGLLLVELSAGIPAVSSH